MKQEYIKIIEGEGALLLRITAPEAIVSVFRKLDIDKDEHYHVVRATFRKSKGEVPDYHFTEESINKSIKEGLYGEGVTNIFEAAVTIALRGPKGPQKLFYIKKLDRAFHTLKIEGPKITADVYTSIETKEKTIRFELPRDKVIRTSPDKLDIPKKRRLAHALCDMIQENRIRFLKTKTDTKKPETDEDEVSREESIAGIPQ